MQAIEKKVPGTYVADDRSTKVAFDDGDDSEEWGTENKYALLTYKLSCDYPY